MLGITKRTLIACSIMVLPLLALSAGAVENEINGVSVVPADGKVRIEISKAGDVTFNAFTMSEPDRLVINCVGAKYNVPWQAKDIDSPFVKKVRTSQYQLDPLVISRVVLDLSADVDYKMWTEGSMQIVEVTKRAPDAIHAEVKESAALLQPLGEPQAAAKKASASEPPVAAAGANQLIAEASMGPFLPYIPRLTAASDAETATAPKKEDVKVEKNAPVSESPAPPAPEPAASVDLKNMLPPVQNVMPVQNLTSPVQSAVAGPSAGRPERARAAAACGG